MTGPCASVMRADCVVRGRPGKIWRGIGGRSVIPPAIGFVVTSLRHDVANIKERAGGRNVRHDKGQGGHCRAGQIHAQGHVSRPRVLRGSDTFVRFAERLLLLRVGTPDRNCLVVVVYTGAAADDVAPPRSSFATACCKSAVRGSGSVGIVP